MNRVGGPWKRPDGGAPWRLRPPRPPPTGEDELEHVSWDEWFQKFDNENLAFLYQEEKAGGGDSTFFKLVSRDG